jgi:F-type H+-transporting ATPase subunit b
MATTPIIAHSLAAVPVVDIDNTIFVQGAIYLLLVVILNPLLFKPWLAAQRRRHDAIEGAIDKAKRLRDDADLLSSEYDTKLAAARDRALDERSRIRRQEETEQAARLAAVRDESAKTLESERARVDDEARKARHALSGRVDELAEQITLKLLGRAS